MGTHNMFVFVEKSKYYLTIPFAPSSPHTLITHSCTHSYQELCLFFYNSEKETWLYHVMSQVDTCMSCVEYFVLNIKDTVDSRYLDLAYLK